MNTALNYDQLEQFKEHSLALRLLRSQHFALLASFFHHAFIATNRRSIPYLELVSMLEQHLFNITDSYGEERYPKSARAYIDDWINAKGGYLRKYLPQQADEPECDLLPEVEKVLRWLEEIQGRQFVGTESRLKMLLDLIGELVQGTSEDRTAKLHTLQARKAEIEQEIIAVELGQDSGFSDTQIRERLFLLANMSRQLLGDFRQVEANFRSLDKETRKTISLRGGHKGEVLDHIFSHQDVIDDSDEGQSFSAFFELLMTPQLRDSMRHNLQQLLDQEQGKVLVQQDALLSHLYSYLLEAGAKVHGTRQQITDQLRRYIQEQSQDNRRIIELINQFEALAHQRLSPQASDQPTIDLKAELTTLAGTQAAINTIFSRQLYQDKGSEHLNSQPELGDATAQVDLTPLLAISHIDELQLQKNISQCLLDNGGQTTLEQVITRYPLRYGLDELLTYIKLACEQILPAHIDEQQQQTIRWQPEPELTRTIQIPTITFIRSR
ncbi:DUF3375 domain-containing protein [Oceanisphaera pacifica]|uniref:DUF3375 domain-containing protein n=1 Tax=Oceanisphaera pacifica TaxID=2818389 RepID=A0ABS3NGG6_9GAMM|nr:DUF3375 domain-containing protein [Oceanisphaera pacifica]MBO1519642.1 DUF3375 domain-containing protein [Oceanisphaera pacifica]